MPLFSMHFKWITLTLAALCVQLGARGDEPATGKMAVKLNSLGLIGIMNPAFELQVKERMTLQLEGLGIFYLKSGFLGSGAVKERIVMGASWLEARFYRKKAFSGFYWGPNMGWSSFRFNKGFFPFYEKRSDSYQVGFNWMAGLTCGYVWALNPQWKMDFSWGGGYQCATYEAYLEPDGERVVPVNGSGEWMPIYKGGISLVYLF